MRSYLSLIVFRNIFIEIKFAKSEFITPTIIKYKVVPET